MQPVNKKILLFITIGLTIFFLFGLIFKTTPAKAVNAGTINLSSSCTSCEVGSNVAITVSATTARNAIGAVEVNLNYDKTKLQYQSVSHFSGPNDFSDILSEQVDQGVAVIHIEAGKQGGLLSGSGNIFSASFKVLSAGNASFSAGPIDGANQDGRVLLTSNSLNITLVAATNPPPGGDNGSGSDTSDNTASTATNATTPARTASGSYDFSKSEVNFDKISALPNGNDKICAGILVKNYSKIVTNLKPTIKTEGGVDLSDITLSKNIWSVCATSSLASDKRIMISVKDRLIKDQTIVFLTPATTQTPSPEPTAPTVEQSTSDATKIIIAQLSSIEGMVSIASKKDLINRTGITDVDLVQISGTAEPDTQLRLYIHSPVLIQRDVTVGSGGKWSTKLDAALNSGAHRVEAAIVDSYGQESDTKLISRFSVTKSLNKQVIILFSSFLAAVLTLLIFFLRRRRQNRLLMQSLDNMNVTTSSEPIAPPVTANTQPIEQTISPSNGLPNQLPTDNSAGTNMNTSSLPPDQNTIPPVS